MERELLCLRCGAEMHYLKREKIQLGETGWILGDLPNLFAGAIAVDIYACPDCGKIEFFSAQAAEEELPKKQCPRCGNRHDFDYPKCPVCKCDYFE